MRLKYTPSTLYIDKLYLDREGIEGYGIFDGQTGKCLETYSSKNDAERSLEKILKETKEN